jgi:hypothetical protein
MGSIRHVMLEIGKLTSKVDRLIEDVDKNSAKTVELSQKIATFETTAKVLVACVTIGGLIFWWALGDKIKILVDEAFKNAYSPPPATVQTPKKN